MIDVLIHQATRTEPSEDELRTQSLTRLGKTYGIARSTLYNRKQRLINPRQHHQMCTLYCTNWDPDLDDAHEIPDPFEINGCQDIHACWCAEGGLSCAQFGAQHPSWLTLAWDEWLDTSDGSAWQAEMLRPYVRAAQRQTMGEQARRTA
jgi:hypothetical protein